VSACIASSDFLDDCVQSGDLVTRFAGDAFRVRIAGGAPGRAQSAVISRAPLFHPQVTAEDQPHSKSIATGADWICRMKERRIVGIRRVSTDFSRRGRNFILTWPRNLAGRTGVCVETYSAAAPTSIADRDMRTRPLGAEAPTKDDRAAHGNHLVYTDQVLSRFCKSAGFCLGTPRFLRPDSRLARPIAWRRACSMAERQHGKAVSKSSMHLVTIEHHDLDGWNALAECSPAARLEIPAMKRYSTAFRWAQSRSLFGDVMVIGFVLMQCLDGVFTYLGVGIWGPAIEANPLIASAMAAAGVAAAVGGAKAVAISLGIVLHLLRVHYLVALLTCIYFAVAILPWTVLLLAN
jgi:hypothetical protein